MANVLKTEFVIEEGNSPQKIHSFEDSLKSLNGDLNNLGKNADFGKRLSVDFDKLHTKANSLQKDFSSIAKTRIDSGSIGGFTKEIVRASERSRQLSNDITQIKAELASPNRKSSIAFLTGELKGAEREADSLQRKLSGLQGAGAAGGGGFTKRFGSDNKLSGFQKQNLSYQVNDVLTGLASGQNPAQILAQQGGQIAQIFSAQQAAALVATYGSLVAVVGAGAAAIALTYKITGDLRAEAEKRLKVEENIASVVNRQILSSQELVKNIQKARMEAAQNRNFSDFVGAGSIDDLKRRRANLERLNQLVSPTDTVFENGKAVAKPSETYLKRAQEIQALDAQIAASEKKNQQSLADSVNQRWESWKKSQADAVEFAKKKQEEFEKSVEKGKQKVTELGNQYKSLFDSLIQKQSAGNPFAMLFNEGDKSLERLRENTKGLSADLISQFSKIEAKANSIKLFETRLDNQLSSFSLRQDAANFRNPFDSSAQAKSQNEFIDRFLRNNPNYLYLQNKTDLDEATRADILRRFAPSSVTETAADRFNQSLQQKADLLFKRGLSNEELSIADRKFINLTSGVNPLELTDRLRQQAAAAREREAVRQETAEREAREQRAQQIQLQRRIAENTEYLKQIAQKEGFAGVIEILDKSNGSARVLGASPTPQDTAQTYDLGFAGGTNR